MNLFCYFQLSKLDGLPQRLCKDCHSVLNSAYQFRSQCIKMDSELKAQLEALFHADFTNPLEPKYNSSNNDFDEHSMSAPLKSEIQNGDEADEADLDFGSNPLKQLESIIKSEPMDSDDDCYYVLVIDDQKNKKAAHEAMKTAIDVPAVKLEPEPIGDTFEDTVDSFLSRPKVSDIVPATILENEEEDDEVPEDYHSTINEASHDDASQETILDNLLPSDLKADQLSTEDATLDGINTQNKYFKLYTVTGPDGKLVLKASDDVTYDDLDDNEDSLNPDDRSVVLYQEGESNQFQIVNCDGDLVIECEDASQIATVLQQDDGTFLCDCGQECEDLVAYERHQDDHRDEEHTCNLCGKGFECAEILTGHMLLHKVSGVTIMCPFCHQLIRRSALTQHIKYGHNNVKPRCNICKKSFANPNNLKRHMMIHTGVRQFECDICLKRFHQKITMQTHRLTHIDPFACKHCDLTFDGMAELEDHRESKKCNMSKLVKVKEELIKAVKQEVMTQNGKCLGYACSVCKKMFSVESTLEQHILSSHMIDPLELSCTDCGEMFPSTKELHSHVITHKSVKNKNMKRFSCSICGKGCSSHAMLIMHERVHTNERPFPCQLCALKFKTKTHLRTHQLTHTREKKFGCSVCMKFFALKGNLVVHLRTHTGERPYSCDMCDDAFIDSKYLKKHKLKKHIV